MPFVSENGKYLRFEVEVWQGNDGSIHIVYDEKDGHHFITTVNDGENSERKHGHLYRHLKRLLLQHDRWDDTIIMKE